MSPTISTQPLTSARRSDAISMKGGEKGMASEWEELEKLSKDELIIELVHWKNLYGIIRVEQDSECPWPYIEPLSGLSDDGWLKAGQITTDSWAAKIAKYASSHVVGDEFNPVDLMDYDLDENQAIRICGELRKKKELVLPSDVEYTGDVE